MCNMRLCYIHPTPHKHIQTSFHMTRFARLLSFNSSSHLSYQTDFLGWKISDDKILVCSFLKQAIGKQYIDRGTVTEEYKNIFGDNSGIISSSSQYKNSAEIDVTPALSKVNGARNLGQGHRLIVRAWKVWRRQFLWKLSPLRRNAL